MMSLRGKNGWRACYSMRKAHWQRRGCWHRSVSAVWLMFGVGNLWSSCFTVLGCTGFCCLQADIILMCANAKVYNHPNTKPHKEADVIFKYSMKYVSTGSMCNAGASSLHGHVQLLYQQSCCLTACCLFVCLFVGRVSVEQY